MTSRVWVVREGDGRTVKEVVVRAGGDAQAIADGRVFLGRKRIVSGDHPVVPGDEITIATAVVASLDAIEILAREEDLVAVDKPAGIPTIADHAGASHALVARTARALGLPQSELHPTSRLDREVSGVVIFALTPAAAKRLKEARDEHTYERRYVALAAAAPDPDHGLWEAPIGRANDPRHRKAFGREATPARSRFDTIAKAGATALLALGPETGRTHQLRVHAAHAGAPLLGDRTYKGPAHIVLPKGRVLGLDRIMLHAARVTVPGAKGGRLVVDAPIPAAMTDVWTALGGDPSAWDTARACKLRDP